VTVARKLHAGEEVLSYSYGPSHELQLSFREKKQQVQPPPAHDQHNQQHKPPVTAEVIPPTNDATGNNKTVQ